MNRFLDRYRIENDGALLTDMNILDADGKCLRSSGGQIATRDLVQFIK
jgi:hypothetical protein